MISEVVQKLESFRAEAARRGIPTADVERWLGVARPSATLGPDVDGPVVGRWGGNPMLPADVPHPRFTFVASIDCVALPREATDLPMPPDGHLLFFADPEQSWEGRPGGTVVYVPAGTAVAERALDSGPDPAFETLPVQTLRVAVDPSLPNRAENTPEHPRGEELSGLWWDMGDDITNSGPLQLGGYPWVWNFDAVEAAREEAAESNGAVPASAQDEDWILLASGDATYVEGLECGLANWVIRRGDLAARRFDRVDVSADAI